MRDDHAESIWQVIVAKSPLHSEPPESKFISEALSSQAEGFSFFPKVLVSCLVLVECRTGSNATKRVQSWLIQAAETEGSALFSANYETVALAT